jgi:sarcosine oxidase
MHLARRGRRVLGLEQFGIGHALGSSGGESRIYRLCYYEHADYVPLLQRAQQLWVELERDADRKLFYLTGGLYLGPETGEFITGSLRAAREHGLPHELLTRTDLKRRYPMFAVPVDFVGMWEPNAGAVMSEIAIAAHAELAMRAGADLHAYEKVRRWHADESGATVETDRGKYQADSLVITTGSWTSRLCAELRVPLKVTRQVVGWLRAHDPAAFAPDRFPIWAADDGAGAVHYGFPQLPGTPGVKLAHHVAGQPTNPDAVDRNVHAADVAAIERIARHVMPEALDQILGAKICMYTNSPDSHFIIDRHPAHANVFLACGLSGHGYKFATVFGEVLADLAIDGKTKHPIGFLSLNRFAD